MRFVSKFTPKPRAARRARLVWRSTAGRSWQLACSLLVCVSFATACQPALEKLPRQRSARGSLGQEVYKALCRHVAGAEIPLDLDGRQSEQLCLADDVTAAAELQLHRAELPVRLVALLERRARFVEAVDELLPEPTGDQLEQLLRGMVPYYDPPEERIQQGSRALARLLDTLASHPQASAGFARYTRAGMVPSGAGGGIMRAASSHEGTSETLRSVLPLLLDGDGARDFRALRSALALELGTNQPSPNDPDHAQLRSLLAQRDSATPSAFSSGAPLQIAARDGRGMPKPALSAGRPPFPFLDLDGDAQADLNGDRFALDPRFSGVLPEPYPVLSEADVKRDTLGRACALLAEGGADCTRTLYEYSDDADQTLLSALLREAGKLFTGDDAPFTSLLSLLDSLIEPPVPGTHVYGAKSLSYRALDTRHSLLLDLLHGGQAALASSGFDDSYALLTELLGARQDQFATALAPLLELEQKTRPSSDAYPEAKLAQPNIFWDELLFELEKLARRRVAPGAESALEGLLRASLGNARDTDKAGKPIVRLLPLDSAAHVGTLLGTFMRYKDDWRANPRVIAKREPNEFATIGSLRVPVDRTQPDAPVSCGHDGCGGAIAGTPFEPFRLPGQRCLVEHVDHTPGGSDCGSAGNQSIFQRGMGLLWEAASRSQCNREISIADLIDEALADPCVNLGRSETCSNDADCALIDIFSSDYVCDVARKQCIATPGSATCKELVRRQQEDRGTAIVLAEQAIAVDYQCPRDVPSAPCHAYEAKYPAAFIDSDGNGPKVASLKPCHVLDLPDVGRTFGRSLTREFTLQIPNPWVRRFLEDVARAGPVSATDDRNAIPDCDLSFRMLDPAPTPACIPGAARLTRALYDEVPPEVNTLGELVEFLLEDPELFRDAADERDLRPDVKVLARVLFSPAGKDSLQLFDPMLIRGAPPSCTQAPKLPACALDDTAETPAGGCCIAQHEQPPLRYRLDTYYGATTFAWEHPIEFADGSKLSLLDALRPIADVFNRNDSDPSQPGQPFEDTDYALTRLGVLIAQHYDSAANPRSQRRDPAASWYRKQTGLVQYETLLADLLDDGTMVGGQLGPNEAPLFAPNSVPAKAALDGLRPALALLEALDGNDLGAGRDGLDLISSSAELYLNPHRFCAGDAGDDRVLDGKGACQLGAGEGRSAPIATRDRRDYPCWNDGRCFDGQTSDTPRRFVSPLYLMLEPLHTLYGRSDSNTRSHDSLHALASGLLDRFLTVEDGKFVNRRALAILRAFVQHARDQRADEQRAGTLESYASRSLAELSEELAEPTQSTLIRVLQTLGRDDAASRNLSALFASALSSANQRPLLASLSDVLQTLDGGPLQSAMSQQLAGALMSNHEAVLAGTQSEPDLDNSVLGTDLVILRKLAELDHEDVFGKLLHRSGAERVLSSGTGASPLEVLSELLFAVNRADAGSLAALDAADIESTFQRMAELMTDQKRGFERLYAIIQCVSSARGSTSQRPAHCAD